jgi:uncharacterized protein DUF4234
MSQYSVSAATREAAVAFSRPDRTALRRKSVIVMVLLTIVTFGVYYPVWFLRRRAALNQLDSPRKLPAWPFVVSLVFVTIRLAVALASGSPPKTNPSVDLLFQLGNLAIGIVIVVQCFFIKDILEDHLAGPGDTLVSSLSAQSEGLSRLMTFFFSIYYLQHMINTRVVPSEP